MCATTAPAGRDRASSRSKRTPRPARADEPKTRTSTFPGRSFPRADCARTTSSATRPAGARLGGEPGAASKEVGVAERELPLGEIRVELAGERLAHEMQPRARWEETGAPERAALSRRRNRDQPFDARRHGQQAGPEQRSGVADEI